MSAASLSKVRRGGLWTSLVRWLDSWSEDGDPRPEAGIERQESVRSDSASPSSGSASSTVPTSRADEVDWLRVVPFLALHLACLGVLWVGWSWPALVFAVGYYLVRMFAITAFYHRYFSHRSFRASRPMQFGFALLGATAVQRGPIWWASHHRAHHRHSDGEADLHSPARSGFWWSHVGWILARRNFLPRLELVRDLVAFPELRFLDRFDVLVPLLSLPAIWGLGAGLAAAGFDTSGAQFVVWGFCISTVVTYHLTFSINSLAHRIGTRRFATRDDSRNNWLLSLFTLGEGWHNNHHRYPASVRQGFYWWELDPCYWALRAMERLGLVRDLQPVPARVLREGRASSGRGEQ